MNPIATYDFTLKSEGISSDDVKVFLKGWAKAWTFQKERGDEGYEHYQGRLSLIKKRRLPELIKAVQAKSEWPFH